MNNKNIITVKEILIGFMRANRCDAIINRECGCACDIDEIGCCDIMLECAVGHKIKSDCNECNNEKCSGSVDGSCYIVHGE